MVDTQALKDLIKEKGIKQSYIVEKLGLSRAGYYKKMTGASYFNSDEMYALCDILQIKSPKQKADIFFAKEGGKKSP
jgi:transcriptional regulator with XRE-family HTH domain